MGERPAEDVCRRCQRPLLPEAEFCIHCGECVVVQTGPATSASSVEAPASQSTPRPSPQGPPAPQVPDIWAVRVGPGRVECQRCKRTNKDTALHCRSCGTALSSAGAAKPQDLITATGVRVGALAGFWVRAAAYVVDSLLLGVVGLSVNAAFDVEPVAAGLSSAEYVNIVISTLYVVVGWSSFGTTVGGRLFRLYVVRPDGSMPGAFRSLVRQLATIASVLTLGFGYLMIGLRPDRRALHDLIADTYVVIKGSEAS